MAIKGYMESTLGSSEIFQGINTEDTTNAQKKAIELIKTAKHLSIDDIETAYISIKQITDGLTRAGLKAFDEGRVVLIYNNIPSLSVTQSLPFITFKTPKGYKTYVFMDKYISISKDGILNLQAPILRDLLISAAIANGLKNNYSNLSTNQYLAKTLMCIYTKFVTRIINREYSIASDKQTFDVIQYWINRFFLERIFGINDTPENIQTVSTSHYKFVDELVADDVKQKYEMQNPIKISDLLNLVKTASPRMKSLNLMTFVSNWMNYYYIPSMLAIDNIEYIILMVVALLNGNNAIISIAASDLVKETKNIKSLRGELLKLIE